MVITLTTGCVLGICSALGLLGAGKGVKAAIDNSEANDTNERAQGILDRAKDTAENARKTAKRLLMLLGKKKMFAFNEPIGRFVKTFSKIKNFEARGPEFSDKIKIGEFNFAEIKSEQLKVSNMVAGAAGGLAAGGAMAFGAFGAVGTFGAVASTGTAIASLSGAAATNATLAWLGGGALGVGGGMAVGAVVLGGLVAGPALAIFGCVVGSQASAKLDQAKSNLAKAKKIKAQLSVAEAACNGIADRAKMYCTLIGDACELLIPQVDALAKVIKSQGGDYRKYSPDAKKTVAIAVSTVQVVKALVDAPILKKDGSLDSKSLAIANNARKYIAAA